MRLEGSETSWSPGGRWHRTSLVDMVLAPLNILRSDMPFISEY